jgi:hypothetical protein
MVTDAELVPVHETVTTTWVAPAFTLKLYLAGAATVTVTVTVCVIAGEVLVPVTTTEYVPLVVIRVGTASVEVLGNVFTEFGETVQVTPDGHPEVTLRLTVLLKPPELAKLSVNEAVPPAPMLCEVGVAEMEKSGPVE